MNIRYKARAPLSVRAVLGLLLATGGTAVAAEPAEGRWALGAFACDGESFTKVETPLLVGPRSVHWFDANCAIVSNYKVNQTLYLQGRCNIAGRAETIPIMLEWLRNDRLRVGWNREPIQEMQRCRQP